VRFTIERIRTLVLIAASLLVIAIAVFLGISKYHRRFLRRDIPERLGINIQQEANGVTYTQAHGGHTQFKIHASRVTQLLNSHATLHDVTIELYGKDGASVDRIQGAEFEYDQNTSIATAAGLVSIEMERPIAAAQPDAKPATQSADQTIRVKTSGVTFNQNTGIVTTAQRVEFNSGDGSGSAIGASYDSELGHLILKSNVALTSNRGENTINVHAAQAEFDRNTQICVLRQATAQATDQRAMGGEVRILFREDGAVDRLNASSGFTISTDSGSRIFAPTGAIEFTAANQPRQAHLEGGVTMDSTTSGRTLHGAAPSMDLDFTPDGDLRHAHLERGVEMQSRDQPAQNNNLPQLEIQRTWRSPVADVEFRTLSRGKVEPASLHGYQGVVITSETRRAGAAPVPSRLGADDLIAQFGPRSTLNIMTGVGHASVDQTAATGARQTATGDRLDAQFESSSTTASQGNELRRTQLDGHVVLINLPVQKPGSQSQQPMHATAGRAIYEATGSAAAPDRWLRLTLSPRVSDGNIDLSADKIDFAQSSGDAFARGNVKATWQGGGSGTTTAPQPQLLGGSAPAHVIASEAQLHQSTGGEAVFRGRARLWQDQNSISAPVIVLNRQMQSLTAEAASSSDPVVAVLLTAEGPAGQFSTTRQPTVVHIRSGDLRYSSQDRKALLRAAPLSCVTAQTGEVESVSDQLELYLSPSSAQGSATHGQIDHVMAEGHVVLSSQGRRGTGSQLLYTASTGNYVLTGSTAAPPRLTDPLRGSVTGESLLFNSRDDSVSIEGTSQRTTTQTTVPR
jgi:lipopolysaccharide export system protein LptA